MWPQIVMIVIWCLGLGIACEQHGKPHKRAKENAWPGIIATAITALILWWGGFWDGLS